MTIIRNHAVLLVLTFIIIIHAIDRLAIVILLEDIKNDLGLTDAQLGFLSGFAFVVLYVAASIPMAYVSDRSNRSRLIGAALMVFGGMTVLCGLAQNFAQLAAARCGVGIGETVRDSLAHPDGVLKVGDLLDTRPQLRAKLHHIRERLRAQLRTLSGLNPAADAVRQETLILELEDVIERWLEQIAPLRSALQTGTIRLDDGALDGLLAVNGDGDDEALLQVCLPATGLPYALAELLWHRVRRVGLLCEVLGHDAGGCSARVLCAASAVGASSSPLATSHCTTWSLK